MGEILPRLKDLIIDIGGLAEPAPGKDVLESYGLDSMQSVQLMVAMEQSFGLTFGADPDDMLALESVEALANWVAQRS